MIGLDLPNDLPLNLATGSPAISLIPGPVSIGLPVPSALAVPVTIIFLNGRCDCSVKAVKVTFQAVHCYLRTNTHAPVTLIFWYGT